MTTAPAPEPPGTLTAPGAADHGDRLRGLLRAHRVITADLTLPVVLRRIAEAACELVGARYGALGVVGQGGVLEQFIHVGVDADTVARIGDLPRGHGILGLLIAQPFPVRIDDLSAHPRAVGFPPDHPPMSGFLGVPIRVRGEVYGVLYLTEPAAGTFTPEDEELTTALAATAGVAIDNARHLDEARRGQQWLRASAEITRELLRGPADCADPLLRTVVTAQRIAEAEAVAVVVPAGPGMLRLAQAAGTAADDVRDAQFADDTPLGRAVTSGRPLLVPTVRGSLVPARWSDRHHLGSAIVAPMADARGARGALVLVRTADRVPFTAADLEMAATFADHVTLALQLDEARAHAERVAILEDRERIARDLHDHVIQRLFATGLGLEGLAAGLAAGLTATADPARPAGAPVPPAGRPLLAARLGSHITDLDETIRQIRASIFDLQQEPAAARVSVRGRLLELANSSTRMLGFDPQVHFTGPIDTMVGPDLAQDLTAVVREALSNIVRHASATSASIHVHVSADSARLEICDDGVGLRPAARRESGLANLRARAERRGGRAEIGPAAAGGVRLLWQVPLASD